ncbi:glycine--tRNA ligase subunit alpha [Candidatus Zinderia endosymbiont of Aphrophora alni]|uniref:glycine--tRNA ligase subunit alpha n=1 Tax=Candidatus Zinderia endosymbiont of Aphrophora alni TaxID=3077951 RepID=UPI0030CC7405
MGAGTSHTATFLKAIGPEHWKAAYIQNSRRPKDGKYGKNFNKIQNYFQYQVVLKPTPDNFLDLYINSLKFLKLNFKNNDIRFIEDNWKNPTLGSWGVGWEVKLNGIEITQITYFQQVGCINCNPILGEITYGIERLAMHLQNNKNINNLIWTEIKNKNKIKKILYKELFIQNEYEFSLLNFNFYNKKILLETFNIYEKESKRLINLLLIFPSYEMMLKSTHIFNLLEATGTISAIEKINYIYRIKKISCKIAKLYLSLKNKK